MLVSPLLAMEIHGNERDRERKWGGRRERERKMALGRVGCFGLSSYSLAWLGLIALMCNVGM